MELRPHDIVRIGSFILPATTPGWANETFARTPYAVVTRAHAPVGYVQAGLRGPLREQRLPLLVPIPAVEFAISPESLAQQTLSPRQIHSAPCFRDLARFRELASDHNLCWGPVGSVGFQLATGSKATTVNSDLDIIVRMQTKPGLALLKHLSAQTKELAIDILLESEQGAVSLAEYIHSPQRTLIRTVHGPQLGIFAT